jgi:cytochrome oxidase Cu insertion factor (SCO1/SenC/PrrC family)
MIRALRAIGIGLAAIVAVGCCVVLIGGPGLFPKVAALLGVAPPDPGGEGTLAGVSIGGPFKLTNAKTGAAVTEASYRGRWMLVYFGYTFCPDICPTDLAKMVAALADIGAPADRITPIFITVDPGRDSAVPLARYVGLFSPKLVGLTGTQAQIDAADGGYRVYVEKVPPASPGAPYLVNHSAFMYLMNPAGKLAAIFPPDIKTADLARQLAADTASPAS